uniref:Uncharacterized protein n=1 Tax=Bracon brevicornis TaxID=1563983 RepID=A0A6V7JL47_9HYME
MKTYLANLSYGYPARDDIMALMRNEIDRLHVPSKFKDEIKWATGSMGTKIENWLLQMKFIYGGTNAVSRYNILDHIHWGYLGCIDPIKTINSIYKAKLLPMTRVTWWWLYNNCVEDSINDFWMEITCNNENEEALNQGFFSEFGDPDTYRHYWILRLQNKLNLFGEIISDYDDSESIDEYMFRIANTSNIVATKYFWDRLDVNQRERTLRKMMSWRKEFWFNGNFDENLEYSMFLMKLYANAGFEEDLIKKLSHSRILDHWLLWPSQDSFSSAFEACTDHRNAKAWFGHLWNLRDFISTERLFMGHELRGRSFFIQVWNSRNEYGVDEETMKSVIKMLVKNDEDEMIEHLLVHDKFPGGKEKIERIWKLLPKREHLSRIFPRYD